MQNKNVLNDLYTATQNNKAHFNIIMGDFNAKVWGVDAEMKNV